MNRIWVEMNTTEEDLKAPERLWIAPIAIRTGLATNALHEAKEEGYNDIEYIRADLLASAIAAERVAERSKVWKQAEEVINDILISNRGAFTLAGHVKDGFERIRSRS